MEEDFHYFYRNPLATLKLHQRFDKKFSIGASRPATPRYRRICRRIPAYLLILLVILATIGLIFASLVFRARSPVFELREVKVKSMVHKNSLFNFENTTLVMDATIDNKNLGRFEIENGTVSLLYGGDPVADAAIIKAGRWVRARGISRMNITMDLTTDKLSDWLKKILTRDVKSGLLKLRSYGQLQGRVYLMKFVNTSKVSVMDCNIWINVSKNRIQKLAC